MATQVNAAQEFHKGAVREKEVDQPIPRLFSARQTFLWSLWQLNTERRARLWRGGGTQVSITSPETPGALKTNEGEETETWTLFIDTAHRGKEFQMGGITGSIVWLAEAL